MSDELLDLGTAWIFCVRNDAGGMSPVFVIDGRKYGSPEALRRDVDEAWDHLHSTGVLFDFETTWGPNMFVPPTVPTWDEYRQAQG